ncbi:MAG: aldo/keto reductase [Acidobacteria bacterium]|nr:aldo/keto reductase [Acidobacteriota bacterium]
MEKRQFGKTDMQVSLLGYGGAEIGFEGATPEGVKALLNEALDAGLNVIDTAAAYLTSEELIGNAVSGRRKDFYLFTKCGAAEGFTKFDWSKTGLLSHIETSLRALKTDYVDLIQLHSCSREVLEKGEAIEALKLAQEKGYTRYIGYSGDGEDALYAIKTGTFDTLQTSISIADQEAIDLLLPVAREYNLGVITKRPIANAVWRNSQKPENSYHHVYWDRIKELNYDFLSSPESFSIALRFTLSQAGVHTAIVGTKQPGRWQANAEMLKAGTLSHEEISKIRARWKEVGGSNWKGQI